MKQEDNGPSRYTCRPYSVIFSKVLYFSLISFVVHTHPCTDMSQKSVFKDVFELSLQQY